MGLWWPICVGMVMHVRGFLGFDAVKVAGVLSQRGSLNSKQPVSVPTRALNEADDRFCPDNITTRDTDIMLVAAGGSPTEDPIALFLVKFAPQFGGDKP